MLFDIKKWKMVALVSPCWCAAFFSRAITRAKFPSRNSCRILFESHTHTLYINYPGCYLCERRPRLSYPTNEISLWLHRARFHEHVSSALLPAYVHSSMGFPFGYRYSLSLTWISTGWYRDTTLNYHPRRRMCGERTDVSSDREIFPFFRN